MKLEDIYDKWEEDCKIEITDLGTESLKIPNLHAKWHRVYSEEKRRLRAYEADLKSLKHDKFEFYLNGPTKEQIDAGWKLPPKGKILKADVSMYVEADDDVITLTLKLGDQQDKLDILERIVTSLQSKTGFSSRTTQIKNTIDFLKWTNGS